MGQLPYQGIKSINESVEKEILAMGNNISDKIKLPQIYTYQSFIENAFPEATRRNDFFPCVMPNWDNTPRSGYNGFVLQGATPELYKLHLEEAISLVDNYPSDKKLIFVKSWNEWAEGNYLEPDLKHGRDFLDATLAALKN